MTITRMEGIKACNGLRGKHPRHTFAAIEYMLSQAYVLGCVFDLDSSATQSETIEDNHCFVHANFVLHSEVPAEVPAAPLVLSFPLTGF